MSQIRLGYKNGLTDEQVKVYATKAFRSDQMKQIRIGFESNLNDEQVKAYAKSQISSTQMEMIRKAFEENGELTPQETEFINLLTTE